MAKREPTRNVIFRPKEADRRERPWTIAFFAFLILYVCVTFALDDASPVIIHGIWGGVLVVGLAGFMGAGIVRGLKSRQRFRLVFTVYWTEPKRIKRLLARWDFKRRGPIRFAMPMILLGLMNSFWLVLAWLLSWSTSKLDPSKEALPVSGFILLIIAFGVGLPALLFLLYVLEILFTSRVVGFDSKWMGFLQGIPYLALWPYEQVAQVRFEWMRVGEQEFRLMIVSPREGREVEFGLSDEVDVQRVTAFLADKGVEVAGV